MHPPRKHAARGFTLIEALVALLVMAFGMLAIAGFQFNLSRSSDVAKQRTEATRLAQAKMEDLRSFEQLGSQVGKVAYADLADGSDTPTATSNTTYERRWTVEPDTADALHRTVSVTVAWRDRANEQLSVNLVSVIAKSEPADGGSLAAATNGDDLRMPPSRIANVPLRATELGGANTGKSTVQWRGATAGWLVFTPAAGDVLSLCATQPDDTTDTSLCTQLSASLLLGFLNGEWVTSVTGVTLTNTQYLGASPSPPAPFECYVEDATDFNANTPTPITGFKFYGCLIVPSNHDGNASTPKVWSGKLNVVPAPAGSQKVCRYVGNASNSSGVYTLVTDTLDNQNFQLKNSGACAAGTTQNQP